MSDFWDDRPDHLTPQIKADFGTDGFYERYAKAQDLVTNRHSKAALVSLVTYLLKSEAQLAEAKEALRMVDNAVYNDNGDVTYDTDTMGKAHKVARATLAKLEKCK